MCKINISFVWYLLTLLSVRGVVSVCSSFHVLITWKHLVRSVQDFCSFSISHKHGQTFILCYWMPGLFNSESHFFTRFNLVLTTRLHKFPISSSSVPSSDTSTTQRERERERGGEGWKRKINIDTNISKRPASLLRKRVSFEVAECAFRVKTNKTGNHSFTLKFAPGWRRYRLRGTTDARDKYACLYIFSHVYVLVSVCLCLYVCVYLLMPVAMSATYYVQASTVLTKEGCCCPSQRNRRYSFALTTTTYYYRT